MISISKERDHKDFEIDIDNLHIEWLKQPVICDKYVRLAADAEKEKAQVRARLDEEIRAADPKVSEAKMKALIDADEHYIVACHRCSLADGDMKSVSHRKESLVNEVTLWLAGYFATTGLPKTVDGFDPEKVALERTAGKIRGRLNRGKE